MNKLDRYFRKMYKEKKGLTVYWKDLMSERPADTPLAERRLAEIPELAKRCGFRDDQLDAIGGYVREISGNPDLFSRWAAALAVFGGFCNDGVLECEFPLWFYEGMRQEAFLLVLAIGEIPSGEERHRQQELPVEKVQESLASLRVWVDNCERNYGVTGLRYDHGFAWIALRLLPGVVMRFGCLEFNRSRAFADILVFRHRSTGEIAALLNRPMKLTAQGFPPATGDKVAFRTQTLGGCFDSYMGNLLSEDGRVIPVQMSVSDARWECILRPWDPVLYMHIPEACGLKPEAVQAAFDEVTAFYARPESDFHPKAIVSGSWLFDPILQKLLPKTSNLCQFQRTGWLLPSASTEHEEIYRVFGAKAVAGGIHAVEWKTSLQKALGEYLDAGGVFRGGRFMILL